MEEQQAGTLQEAPEQQQETGSSEATRRLEERSLALEEELARVRQTLLEREARVHELDAQLAAAQETRTGQQEEIRELQEELAAALGRYRGALLEGAPEVPQELVQGESVQALEESFSRARELVERVRRQVEAKLAKERVPPGVPPRRPLDISGLSSKDKIALGLQRL